MKYKCICQSCKYINEKWNGEHCADCSNNNNFDPIKKLNHELESGFYHTEREELPSVIPADKTERISEEADEKLG